MKSLVLKTNTYFNNIVFNEKISNEKYNIIIFLLMMSDYLLTYVGINVLEFITEGNALMVWLFELPLFEGLIIRTLMGMFVYALLKIIQKLGSKHYQKVIKLIIVIEMIPHLLHLIWIIQYLSLEVLIYLKIKLAIRMLF